MRPLTLSMEGFTAFREKTVVSFADHDLFALTGPTGSGKSTVLDAMTFALYGNVERLGKRDIEPILSKGLSEAKVGLDFEANAQMYRVARVVRRTKTGAKTAEASLEKVNGEHVEVMAKSEKDVSAAVERLLGLDLTQFNRCVILPQGKFDTFLKSEASQRQGILRKMLNLDLYRRIGEAARQRAAELKIRIETNEDNLGADPAVKEAELKQARQRLQALTQAEKQLTIFAEQYGVIANDLAESEKQKEQLSQSSHQLQDLTLPAVDLLPEKLAEAERQKSELQAVVLQLEEDVQALREQLASSPKRLDLERHRDGHRRKHELEEKLRAKAGELETAENLLAAAQQAYDAALQKAEKAATQLEEGQKLHAALHLRSGLVVGDACPVCEQSIEALPGATEVTELEALQQMVAQCQADLKEKNQQQQQSSTASQRVRAELRHLEEELRNQSHATPLQLNEEETDEALEQLNDLEMRASQTLETLEAHRKKERGVQENLDSLQKERRGLEDQWHRVRNAVADLNPPDLHLDDMQITLEAYKAWQATKSMELRQSIQGMETRLNEQRTALELLQKQAMRQFDAIGMEASEIPKGLEEARRKRTQLEVEMTYQEAEIQRLHEARRKIGDDKATHTRMHALAEHLKANNFEKWLLQQEFNRLLYDASKMLKVLSRNAYSFQLATGDNQLDDIRVVDHLNADETRSTKTLSGGETFLASLALALTLSESTQQLAVNGACKLDSVFLDEGFGTLDGETLEEVTNVLEELGNQGRMVGIVTHVKELAERMPVQFQVTKISGSSRIEKLIA